MITARSSSQSPTAGKCAASVASWKEKGTREKDAVEQMKVGASRKKMKRLERIGQCGIWLSIAPLKLGGSCLSFDEFMDTLRGQYGLKQLGLFNVCNRCVAPFMVAHALSCKKGGLVSIWHNDARNKAGALAMHALQASKVTYESMINNGREPNDTTQRRATQGTGNQAGKESRGDMLVHGLCETGTLCVLDICMTETYAPSF